jgi:2-succinyl-5-enolpyruvyl-6-hydroxy-3-cyclohexene-1-carboxylate synthase
VTGDLSFFYDANGLWNSYINSDFRIILINNHGGGIFKILPGHKENKFFSSFIETPHRLSAKQLAKMHGFKYQNKISKLGLRIALRGFFQKSSAPKILEITTSSKLSSDTLKNYFQFLSRP